MADLKFQFYREIGNDFNENMTNSFLYRYLKKEKDSHVRLQLKRQYANLSDAPEEKKDYALFLVKILLTENDLQKHIAKLQTLPCFLDAVIEACGEDAVSVQTVGEKKAALRTVQMYLKKQDRLELERKQLASMTEELCSCFAPDGARKDLYIVLKDMWLTYRSGGMTDVQYLERLLVFLADNRKVRLEKETRERMFKPLFQYGRQLAGEACFAGVRKDADRFRKIAQWMQEKPEEANCCFELCITQKYLREITQALLDSLLKQDCRALLYDAGYRGNTGAYSETAVGADTTSRKKERSMDMLGAYFAEAAIDPFHKGKSASGENGFLISEEQYSACDKLLKRLNEEKRESVCIPLKVDPFTGGGLYILGKKYYKTETEEKQERVQKQGRAKQSVPSCAYCCVTFQGPPGESERADNRLFSIICDEAVGSVKEAISWFDHEYNEDSKYDYTGYNGLPPEDCPEQLLGYFEKKETEREAIKLDARRYQEQFAAEQRAEKQKSGNGTGVTRKEKKYGFRV